MSNCVAYLDAACPMARSCDELEFDAQEQARAHLPDGDGDGGESRSASETHLLMRGAYDKPGDKVEPGLPAVLPPLPAGAPNNRLGLRAVAGRSRESATARVTVNRFWQMYFGTGLVKTVEDFGSQGEWPSHPELLDWLATEFVRTGWDVKAMQKMIVTSATYRQSSKATPELLQTRSGEPAAGARPALPLARGDDPRSGAARGGSAGREARRSVA